MNICIHDNGYHLEFAPLTLMKPLAKVRMGLMTIEERWSHFLDVQQVGYSTENYLQEKFPNIDLVDVHLAANVLPNAEIAKVIREQEDVELYVNGHWTASKGTDGEKIDLNIEEAIILEKRWHLFTKNESVLKSDFELKTQRRNSGMLSSTVTVIGDPNLVFLEKGAVAEACVLNVKDGPIYLDKDAEIMEGCLVRGPLGLGEHAALKMGAKIYGGTSIGPHCKVGGEVGNSLFQGYSNKGHDGYVGNSLIGEWCNLGADTNTSNLKNNYSLVRTYSYEAGKEITTDQQFIGLTMGDHSKCGINTMFNTATVTGISCNIYGGDFPQKFIPSFSWGGSVFVPFQLEKAFEAAENMMKRRKVALTDVDKRIFRHLFPKQAN